MNELAETMNSDFINEQKNTRRSILELMVHWCPLWVPYVIGFFCQQTIEPLKYGYFKFKHFNRFLEESQWWTLQKLEEYQNTKLKSLIEYVYKNVPYYEGVFKSEGLSPEDFCTIEDLEKLPLLTREDIIKNFDKLIARNIPLKEMRGRLDLRHTSGSTGKPMICYVDKKYDYMLISLHRWVNKILGIDAVAPHIRLWSRPFIEKRISDIKLYEPYCRRLTLSTVPQEMDRLEEHLRLIKTFKPVYIKGQPSSLYALACYAQNKGYRDVHFRTFLSCSENLYPYQKEAIESQFQCEIFRYYGTEEVSMIAMECKEHEGLHIETRKGVMEIIGKDSKVLPRGQRGRIVYTGFNNYVMPLIRYELGDIGIISDKQCSCGRGLPLLKSLDGRSSEIIKYNNKNIFPTTLSVVFERMKNIKECQFIQDKFNKIRINIVRRENYSPKDSEVLIEILRHLIDEGVDPEISFVNSIPRTQMGKFQFVINHST